MSVDVITVVVTTIINSEKPETIHAATQAATAQAKALRADDPRVQLLAGSDKMDAEGCKT